MSISVNLTNGTIHGWPTWFQISRHSKVGAPTVGTEAGTKTKAEAPEIQLRRGVGVCPDPQVGAI